LRLDSRSWEAVSESSNERLFYEGQIRQKERVEMNNKNTTPSASPAPDTTASASADAGLLYCHVCTNHRQASCGDKDCGIDSRAAQPVQAGEVVGEHEQAIDLMRKLERDGLEFVCMDGSANVVGIIKAAWKYRASLAPVSAQPELTVWYGPMPESSGAQNFTATLMRKGASMFDTDQYIFSRSEYPDRVRYEADFMRYLIGERAERPELWDKSYDADKHSGYVAPVSAQQGAAVAAEKPGQWGYNVLTERMEPRENGGFYLAREADKWAAHPAPAAQAVDARDILADFSKLTRYAPNRSSMDMEAHSDGRYLDQDEVADIIYSAASPASTPEGAPEQQQANVHELVAALKAVKSCNAPLHPALNAQIDAALAHALQPAAPTAAMDLIRQLSEGRFNPDMADKARAILAASTAGAATTSEDARDAARYRWLREQPYETFSQIAFNTWNNAPFVFPYRDQFIDAAMRATQKEGGK
jgi:hypothetical protein